MSMYNPKPKVEGIGWRRGGRRIVGLEFKLPSMTKQEFAAECDINNIMAKYLATGLISHVNRYQGSYEDVADVASFQEAQDILREAGDAFNSLTSSIRDRFHNDPAAFLEFVSKPENRDEMIKMGLIVEPPPSPPPVAPPPVPSEEGK